jgi:hypothetical protein
VVIIVEVSFGIPSCEGGGLRHEQNAPLPYRAQRGGLVIDVPEVFAESFPTRRPDCSSLPALQRLAVEKVSETVIVVGGA